MDQIVAGVESGQAGNHAVLTALNPVSRDKHQISGPMIGAQVHVFGNAPPEFREHHHNYVVRTSDPLKIFQERGNRV